MNDTDYAPWIDPILHRPEAETWSVRAALYQLFSSATCANVPKSEMYQGGDVSQWQGEMDWNKFFDNGMRYAIIRAMINGRADEQYDRNVQILIDQKRKFLVYGATGYPTVSNAIPYARALADLVRGVPYLAVWWDSEASGMLSPLDMKRYNEDVLGELEVQLPGTILEIYTRQSFWDSSVAAGDWDKYPLAAARYNEQLTCPWSDGRFVFRDWDDWRYWQISQCWDGELYGAKSRCIDGDFFNGNEKMFNETYKIIDPEPENCCDEHSILIDGAYTMITQLNERVQELENKSHEHDEPEPPDPEPPTGTILVEITEKHKAHYFVDDDDSCLPNERGKPFMRTDDEKAPLLPGQTFYCDASLVWSCKDTPTTPTLIANGGAKFFRIAEKGLYEGRFIRKDKAMKVA